MANRYSVTLEYSDYWDSHSNFEFDGKIKVIAVDSSISDECHILMTVESSIMIIMCL